MAPLLQKNYLEQIETGKNALPVKDFPQGYFTINWR